MALTLRLTFFYTMLALLTWSCRAFPLSTNERRPIPLQPVFESDDALIGKIQHSTGSTPAHHTLDSFWKDPISTGGPNFSASDTESAVFNSSMLQRRQCVWNSSKNAYECDLEMPTVDQMIERMRGLRATPDRHVAFYTNLGSYSNQDWVIWVTGWFKSRGKEDKFFWVVNWLDQTWIQVQLQWLVKNIKDFQAKGVKGRPADVFMRCSYQAGAFAAQNADAYVFTKKGEKWREDSHWAMTEFPTLQYNDKVRRFWRVDSRPPEKAGLKKGDAGYCSFNDPELIYDKENPALRPFMVVKWSCLYR